jgi:methionyl-tRNA formyltransferase
MRIAFAGTPEFAAVALQRLIAAGHQVSLVLTQPDRPAGRGMRMQHSPVKSVALEHQIAMAQPRSLRLDGKYPADAAATQRALAMAAPELMVVAAYGLILPRWVLSLPPRGCLNIHASLLPRWRGAAPIHRAIEAGDQQTGITIMQMDEGLDTGDMLLARAETIRPDDSTATLHDRLAGLGGELIVQALEAGHLPAARQPDQGITYAHKIDKAEAGIDWALPAGVIERRTRAFDPFPGASFVLDGEAIKLWRAGIEPDLSGRPGEVLRAEGSDLVVACGEQALRLLQLQRPGGRRIDAAVFLQAKSGLAGRTLG